MMKNIKWNNFKCKMALNPNVIAANMPSFCKNDEIIINYSTLMNYIDSSKFNFNDINCASSPMHSRMLPTRQNKTQKFNIKTIRKNLSKKLKRFQAYVATTHDSDIDNVQKQCKLVNFKYKQTTSENETENIRVNLQKLRNSLHHGTIEQQRCSRYTTALQSESQSQEQYGCLNYIDDDNVSAAQYLFNNRTSSPLVRSRTTCSSIKRSLSKISYFTADTEFTSTPININEYDLDDDCGSDGHGSVEHDDYGSVYNGDDADNSTQINTDVPVLVESTFNTSSCSNIDNDLIILKHTYRYDEPQKQKHINRTNSIIIDKFYNDTHASFTETPSWANGIQLNLALVNQIYNKPNVAFNNKQ